MIKSQFDSAMIKEIVAEWNINFPIDRWWRQKHKVAFNSPSHREISFLDQLFERMEDDLINSFLKYDKSEDEEEYIPDKNNFLKSQKSETELFEDLDLDLFNDIK